MIRFGALLIILTACGSRTERPAIADHTPPPPHVAAGPETHEQRMARDRIDAYRTYVARCSRDSSTRECADMPVKTNPCAAPRARAPSAVPTSLAHGVIGLAYFDGTRCYQATTEAPGICLSRYCEPWLTIEECQAARHICDSERP